MAPWLPWYVACYHIATATYFVWHHCCGLVQSASSLPSPPAFPQDVSSIFATIKIVVVQTQTHTHMYMHIHAHNITLPSLPSSHNYTHTYTFSITYTAVRIVIYMWLYHVHMGIVSIMYHTDVLLSCLLKEVRYLSQLVRYPIKCWSSSWCDSDTLPHNLKTACRNVQVGRGCFLRGKILLPRPSKPLITNCLYQCIWHLS